MSVYILQLTLVLTIKHNIMKAILVFLTIVLSSLVKVYGQALAFTYLPITNSVTSGEAVIAEYRLNTDCNFLIQCQFYVEAYDTMGNRLPLRTQPVFQWISTSNTVLLQLAGNILQEWEFPYSTAYFTPPYEHNLAVGLIDRVRLVMPIGPEFASVQTIVTRLVKGQAQFIDRFSNGGSYLIDAYPSLSYGIAVEAPPDVRIESLSATNTILHVSSKPLSNCQVEWSSNLKCWNVLTNLILYTNGTNIVDMSAGHRLYRVKRDW